MLVPAEHLEADPEFAQLSSMTGSLDDAWKGRSLKDISEFAERMRENMLDMPPLQRQLVSLLFEQRNILRVVRKGMKEGTHFVWMRDPETFRQLQQRVNDNQEFDVQETSAVT